MYDYACERLKYKASLAEDQATVTRLLDTAERLFGELGYDGVGMRMLADEAK
jgi:AcrR family transcriptional regulator